MTKPDTARQVGAQPPNAQPPSAPPASDPVDHANDPKVLAAAAVTVLLWASAFIAIRGAGPDFDPGAMALLRMAVGSVALGGIAAYQGIKRPPRRAVPWIIGWGVAWFCIYNIALNTAELTIDAGTAAMVVNLAPLMVVALGGLFLGEGFPRGLVIGAPVSFLGVVLIGTQSSGGNIGLWGLFLALVAAVMYAACTLVQKRLLRTVDATTLTWPGAVAGTVALLPWAGRLVSDLRSAPMGSTLGVVYLGIFPTAIAFTTWAYVLARTSAGRTAATTYVVPAIAIVMSWLILDEAPTAMMLVGGALCLLGVFITRLRWTRRDPASR
ncbi:DMT family transporter [Actinomycetota bacterium]